MTTVAQMIEWMKTLPQDAEVECGVNHTEGYETYMSIDPVDIEACEVIDYTSEANRARFPDMAGKVLLRSVVDKASKRCYNTHIATRSSIWATRFWTLQT